MNYCVIKTTEIMNKQLQNALYIVALLPCVSWFIKNPDFTSTHIFPIAIMAATVVIIVLNNKIPESNK